MDIISFKAQYEIQSSLEVIHDFLNCCPMHLIEFSHVLVYNVHGKIKVRVCPYHGIHQWFYCWFVCNVVHCNNCFSYLSSKNFASLACGSRGVLIGLQPSILKKFNIFSMYFLWFMVIMYITQSLTNFTPRQKCMLRVEIPSLISAMNILVISY